MKRLDKRKGSPEHRLLPLKSLLATTCDSGKGVCIQSSKVFFKQVHCASVSFKLQNPIQSCFNKLVQYMKDLGRLTITTVHIRSN